MKQSLFEQIIVCSAMVKQTELKLEDLKRQRLKECEFVAGEWVNLILPGFVEFIVKVKIHRIVVSDTGHFIYTTSEQIDHNGQIRTINRELQPQEYLQKIKTNKINYEIFKSRFNGRIDRA